MNRPHGNQQGESQERGSLSEGGFLSDGGYQGDRRYQGDGGYQRDREVHGDRGYLGDRGPDSNRVYQGDRGYQGDRAYQGERWYQNNRGYKTDCGYQVGNFPNLDQSNRTGHKAQDSQYAEGPVDSTHPTRSPAARQGPGVPGRSWPRFAELFGKGPKGYTRSDERIHEEVDQCLSEGYLDASGIEVSVKDGEVILQGSVASGKDRRLAEELIEHCRGVRDIDNRLKVQREHRAS
ncbi:MAG TPA: BON domain-containing protein [Pseudomonadota bacterium]|nr:BON domain-containing protein [Pseudomonadota bacterium]